MTVSPDTLEPGDIIEIKYRVWRASENADTLVDRWVAAAVTVCEEGSWPLARLADGQMTEIRPFMPWRTIMKARHAIAA